MFFNKNVKDIYILNGWVFEFIIDSFKFNISNQIIDQIKPNKILEISKEFDYKKFINSYNPNYKKAYLKVSNKFNKKWETLTIKEFTPFKLYLGDITFNKKLDIVYFINSDLNNSFFKLFKDQLKDLIRSNIFKYSFIKIHLVIICSNSLRRAKIRDVIKSLKLNNFFEFDLIFSDDQHKEFAGINKVWELANYEEEKLILYFHGKGLSYLENPLFYIRQPLEKFIFKLLIHNWEKNLEKIYRLHSINKIGILTGGNGWSWFNFWIARSSYLSKLEKPKMTKYACYYEDWLGRSILNETSTNKIIYTNPENEKYYNTLDQSLSILDNPEKNKFNLGSCCEVKRGGFVGLGFVKYTYRIWYLFFVVLNKIGLNRGKEDRFIFY